ncbi:MAG TPA: hypothetical protein VNG12_02925 [Acidimicrobiales bacterium]|nr:hypothetical protein [Acidimicrobiales bacterium]
MTQAPTMEAARLGERFAAALAAKDGEALKALLRSDVDFRAMTPGKFWEADDAARVVDETILGTWFSPERRIVEVQSVEIGTLEQMSRVGYRFKVERPEGVFVIEQQAYFETDGTVISWLRIMCSGFIQCA